MTPQSIGSLDEAISWLLTDVDLSKVSDQMRERIASVQDLAEINEFVWAATDDRRLIGGFRENTFCISWVVANTVSDISFSTAEIRSLL